MTSLARLLPEAADREPDAIAVVDGDRRWSYAALEEQSARLAGALAAAGVTVGDRVGLHLPKSAEAIAAMHAVLRLGAVYVPLDPKGPPPRLGSIAADAGLEVVVSSRATASRWQALADHGAPIRTALVVDANADPVQVPSRWQVVGHDELARTAPAHLHHVHDDDPAYVLYTSGSTGVPKGVVLTHGNGSSFVDWAVATLRVGAEDRLSSHAPLHFDLSVFDVFGAAAAGARLVLVPARASMFPVELAAFITREELTIWYSVPSVLSMLVARGGMARGDLSSLRAVVFAGEVFPAPALAQLMRLLPHAEFWNWYGPTETNVCTAHRVSEVPHEEDPPVPIGPVIPPDDAVVLGDDGVIVAPGQEGELAIAGATVSPGYLGRPDLTAERFGAVPGRPGRWYRTGDIVREEPGVGFRFVGRRDHQVKSRGHRIELGEVEAALHSHPQVREAVVVAVPDALVTNRLVAFVAGEGDLVDAALAAHCRGLLPAYMLPERFEVVAELPRTSTEKVDRPALVRRARGTGDEQPGRGAGEEPGRGAGGEPGRGAGEEPGRGAGGQPGRGAGEEPGRGAGGQPGRGAGGRGGTVR